MTKKTGLFLFLCGLVLASCGGIKTYTDYDEQADFANYSSYNFYKDMETGMSALDKKRFSKAIDSTLKEKGFTQAESPDFKVNFYSEVYQKTSRNNIGIGIGALGSNVGGNVSGGIPIENKTDRMRLTIEIIDAPDDQLVWQGEADAKFKAKLSPKERQAYFYKIAQKILKQFPPNP